MSKRFTATEKWDRPWFRDLPNEYKLLWIFICDKCDISGTWYVDMRLAEFSLGIKLDCNEAKRLFSKQIDVLNDGSKWFIKDFISFQYGELVANNNLHRAVIKCLEISGASQPLVRVLAGDKVMVKDKVKERIINKECKLFRGTGKIIAQGTGKATECWECSKTGE